MNMNMGTTSSAMDATAASSSAQTTVTMMMSMDMDMNMNTYLTSNYLHYPVLFKHLQAHTEAQAFGIFCLILATTLVYKLTGFVLWYLELTWAAKTNENVTEEQQLLAAKHRNNRIMEFFVPSARTFLQDTVRLVLLFWSTLLVYCLMLVSMTFILTYVFAVVLGLSLFEVAVNRIKIIVLRERRLRALKKCDDSDKLDDCACGDDSEDSDARLDGTDAKTNIFQKEDTSNASETTTLPEDRMSIKSKPKKASCCCAPSAENPAEQELEQEIQMANEIGENGRANADQMDSSLEPRNQFL